MGKKALCLVFAFLLSIESMAAVVSDNDGSAFITKSEFDSLKNNFQSQIDAYNSNIDSKIDTTIATYLSGIKVTTDPENLLDRIRIAMGEPWISNTYATGRSEITTEDRIELRRHFTYKHYNNIKQTIYLQMEDASIGSEDTYYRIYTRNYSTGNPQPIKWWFNLEYSPREKRYLGNATLSGSYFVYNEPDRIGSMFEDSDKTTARLHIWDTDVVWPLVGWNRPGTDHWDTVNHVDELTNEKPNVNKTIEIRNVGDGSYYEYYVTPSGQRTLRSFFTQAYPVYSASIIAHTYKNFLVTSVANFRSVYCTETGMSDNTTLAYTLPDFFTYGKNTNGNSAQVADGSETAVAYYSSQNIYQIQTDDGIDYGKFLVGKCNNSNIYGVSTIATLTADTQKTIAADKTKNTYIHNQCLVTGQKGCDQTLSGCEIKYKSVKSTPGTFKITDFVNEYVTGVAGESTYLGGGIPIIKTISDDQNINVKIKFKSRNADGSTGSGNVKYTLSDKQFIAGNTSSGSKIYATGTAGVGDEVVLTFKVPTKGNIWCNFYSETDGVDAAIDTMTIKLAE